MAKNPSDNVISHWHHLIGNFQTSPLEFYQCVEKGIQDRQLLGVLSNHVEYREGGPFSPKREYLQFRRGQLVFDICASPYGTGFFFSSWLSEKSTGAAIFLAIGMFVAIAVIASTLMGTAGFFQGIFLTLIGIPILLAIFRVLANEGTISLAAEEALMEVPFFGPLYVRFFTPNTFYKMDTAIMYQEMVHAAVLEAVDALTKAKGARALTELERKPIMKDFFRR
jgi:hypothetical protein